MTPQHLVALDAANTVRLARAALRRDLHAGRVTIIDALNADCAQSMTVMDLLMSQQRWGRKRALRALRDIGVLSELRRVRDLTGRQRHVLELAVGLRREAA